jgi:hypothetical protein
VRGVRAGRAFGGSAHGARAGTRGTDPESLNVFAPGDRTGERALLALAIRIGGTRLIDNVVLGEDPPPIAAEASS